MKVFKWLLAGLAIFSLTACNSTSFERTWYDPSITSMDLRKGVVAAFLISEDTSMRRSFETNLANQLTSRGIETLPGYEVLPGTDVTNKARVVRDLQDVNVDTAVFMQIVDRHEETTFVPTLAWYPGDRYDRFWWGHGGFYDPGFGGAWPYYNSGYYRTDTVVSVDSQVYSVRDGKLLWEGLSKTMNPSKLDAFVKELVSETVKKLKKTGMVPSSS